MKILIVGFYEFSDGYYALGEILGKYCKLKFFALLDWRDRVREGGERGNDLERVVGEFEPDFLLVWHNFEFVERFEIEEVGFVLKDYLRKVNVKKICLNWDLGYGYDVEREGGVLGLFELVFGVCPRYVGVGNYVFYNQGFNERVSYRSVKDREFVCDVSFVGTNLYDDYGNNRECSRRKVLDALVKEGGEISCFVYGTENVGREYPENYKGYVKYDDCHKVFSNSLVTLNISPVNDEVGGGETYYYSERMAQIFGCDGVMVCNNDFGEFVPRDCYVRIERAEDVVEVVRRLKRDRGEWMGYVERVRKMKGKFNYEKIVREQIYPRIVALKN